MTYHYARRPQQHLSAMSREETPATPCNRDVAARLEAHYETGEEYVPSPFDVLYDKTQGFEFRIAQRRARAICDTCPVMAACHTKRAKEKWLKRMLSPIKYAPTVTDRCGTYGGASGHTRRNEDLCDACLTARRERQAANKARRRAAA